MVRPTGHTQPPEPLHLSLSLAGGRGMITLSSPVGNGPLRLEQLEMEIPNIRFPFDLSGGTGRFRHRRCQLRRSALILDPLETPTWLAERIPLESGLRGVALGFDTDTFQVTGRAAVNDQGAPFLLRGVAQPAGRKTRLCICDTWVFGPLPLTGPEVARRLLLAACAHPDRASDAQWVGCCDLLVDPLELALRQTLPVHGWRLPARGGTHLSRVSLTPDGLRLVYDEAGGKAPAVPPRWRDNLMQRDQLREAEELFTEQPERAEALYREHLDDGPARALAEERLLQLLATRADRDEDTLELARTALARDPELYPALLARGAVMLRQGRKDEAAVAYRTLAELCASHDDRTGETLALLTAGHSAAVQEPARARQDFEQVLELDHRNTTAINQLLRLCAEQGDWQRLVLLRQRQLDLAVSPEHRLHTHLALGEIYRVHLDDTARALTQYEQALEIDAECEPALRGRAEACIDADRLEDAVEMLQRLCTILSGRKETDEEVANRLRIASLHEHLDQPQPALDQLDRALELQPGLVQALQQSAVILDQLGRNREAVEKLRTVLECEPGRPALLATHLQLAQQYLALDDLTAAEQQIDHALALDPDNAAARRLTISLAERSQGPDALLDALEQAVEVEQDPGRRQELLLRIARQLADVGRSAEEVAQALRRAADAGIAPDRLTRTWDRIAAGVLEQGDIAGSARLDELAARTFLDHEHRGERLFTAGTRWEKDLHDTKQAIRCYQAALESDPHHRGVLDALEALHTREGNLEPLSRVLSHKVEAAERRPAVQKALLCRLGQLLSELGRREEGHVAFTRALALDADYVPALLHLAREAMTGADREQAQRYYNRLAGCLSRATSEMGPDKRSGLQVETHLVLADLHHREGRHQEEEGQLELALAVDPRDTDVLDRLDTLLSRQERHTELADVLRRRADATRDQKELLRIGLRRGELLESLPGREDDASQAFRDVLRIEPAHAEAMEHLSRLLRNNRRFDELLEVLTRRAELAEELDADSPAPWLEAASLASSRLGDRARAEACLRRALGLAPAAPEVIDALLQLDGAAQELDPQVLLEVGRKHLEAGAEKKAARALRAAVELAAPGALRVAAARALLEAGDTLSGDDVVLALGALDESQASPGNRWRLARLLVERADDDRAVSVLGRLPSDFEAAEQAFQLLQGCLERLGRHRELAEALERHAAHLVDLPRQRAAALVAAARIWTGKVDDPDHAAAALKQAATVEPLDLALIDRAGELLGQERFAGLVQELAGGERSPALQAQLLCRAAEVTRRRGWPWTAAERLLGQALERDPACGEALDRMVQLFVERKDDQRLVETLARLADLGDVGQRVAALLQAADLLANRLQRPEQALQLLDRAAQLDPQDPGIVERRVDLLLILGETGRAEEALLHLADRGHEPERSLLRALGLAQLRDDASAEVSHLRRLARLKPGDPDILEPLVTRLAACGDVEGQAEILEQLAQLDQPGRSDTLLELSRIYAGPLGQPQAAHDALTRFLETHPEHRRALALMASVCKELRRHGELAEMLRRLHRIEPGPLRRAELAASVAQLEQQAGHDDEAERHWRIALQDSPGEPGLIRQLVGTLERRRRWQDLRGLLEETLDAGQPEQPAIRAQLATLLAEVYLDRLGELDAGVRWLQRSCELVPGGPAHDRLVRHHREQGRHAELATVLEQRCATLAGEDLARGLEQLADVQEIHLKDLRGAARSYAAAYRADPADSRRALRAQELFVRTNDIDAALALLDEVIPRTEGEPRGELHACRGRALAIRGLTTEAVNEYSRALEHHPGLHAARAELGRRLFELGHFDAAVPHLQAAAEHMDRPTEREGCAFLAQRALEKLGLTHEPPGHPVTRELISVGPRLEATGAAEDPLPEPAPVVEQMKPALDGRTPSTAKEWEDLAADHRTRADAASSAEERADLLLRAAEILEEHLARPFDAYKIYEEAAAAAPSHVKAVEALADAAYRNQNWHRARELYDQLWLEGSTLPRHDVSYRRGLVHETLGDEHTADLCYAHAISLDPGHRASLEGRARVALARDDIGSAITALEGLSSLISVDDVEDLTATRCKLGELHLRAGNPEAARECLESALSLNPTHTKVMQSLLAAYERVGEFRAMGQLLGRLVRVTQNPLVRASLLHYRAEVLGGHLGDEGAAIDCLLKAYDLAPNYPPTLWRLVDYYWERDDLPSVAEMGTHLRSSTDLTRQAPDLRHVRLAVTAMSEEGNRGPAADLLRIALANEELLPHALRELGAAVDKGVPVSAVAELLRRASEEDHAHQVQQLAQDGPGENGLNALAQTLAERAED